jgi:predicted lipid-binding transport protein (Tim44 family)
MRRMGLISIVVAVVLTLAAAHVPEAFARAGGGGGRGGGSMGSRGSRSTVAPARPAPSTPTAPSRNVAPAPAPSPVQPARPSFFRSIMGGLAGFALGGLLGSLLFGHGGFGFGGIGMLDILLIGAAIALLVMFLRRRRPEADTATYGQTSPFGQPAYAMGGGQPGYQRGSSVIEMEPPAQLADLERGIGHIRQMDPSFDPDELVTWARGVYLDVQTSMKSRDLTGLRDRLTPEIATQLQTQCDELRAARQTNLVERIDLRRVEVTEAWQETGRDYVTIYFAASMLDYTVDDSTGAVVQGSKSEPQDIEDFWTFSRPVGRGPWQLSAIQNV